MAVNRKKILELHDFGDGLSIRQVSEATGNSRNTVRSVVRGAEELGITIDPARLRPAQTAF